MSILDPVREHYRQSIVRENNSPRPIQRIRKLKNSLKFIVSDTSCLGSDRYTLLYSYSQVKALDICSAEF